MITRELIKRFCTPALLLAAAVASLLIGCSTNGTAPSGAHGPSTQPTMASDSAPALSKGGAQLWSETCSRCHNLRPPQYYSDAQWGVIVHHMRLRANLTASEAGEITKFLQASN